MPNNDIIFISDADWNTERELPVHHVVRLLANHHRIIYIDNFGGIRRLGLKDLPRILSKMREILKQQFVHSPRTLDAEGSIHVFQPFIFPTQRFNKIIGKFNAFLMRRAIKRLISHYEVKDALIWTRVPSDTVWKAIEGIPRSALIYQSVDRFFASPTIPGHARSRLQKYELLFSNSADIIFTSAVALYNEKRLINPHTHFAPNGVDTTLFSPQIRSNNAMSAFPRPIIGFIGSLSQVVDYEMLYQSAALTPEWSYVFVGPISPGVELGHFKALQNVHFTGPLKHAELPSYVAAFDCGLIPYVISEFTEFTFPSKLAEYLAAGLPIVATRLPELQPYSDVVDFVDDHENMVKAIRSSLNNGKLQKLREKRTGIARTLNWMEIVSRMEETIEDYLGK